MNAAVPAEALSRRPGIRAAYTSDFGETRRGIAAVQSHGSRMRVVRTVAWLVLAGTVAGALVGLVPGQAVGDVVLVPLVLLMVFWVLPFQMAWTQRRTSPLWTGERTATFDEDGIAGTGLGATALRPWHSVRRVAATREFLLIYVAEGSGFYVPKRAFATPGDVAAVQWLAAQHGGATAAGEAPLRVLDTSDAVAAAEWVTTREERYQVLRAISRHGREPGRRRIRAVLVAMLLLTLGVGVALGGWRRVSPWTYASYGAVLALVFASGPLVAWLGSRFWIPGAAYRRAALVVWPGGVRTASHGAGGDFVWDAFPQVVETPELFLFFVGGMQAFYLPKRLLDASRVAAVRSAVRGGMGEKARLLA